MERRASRAEPAERRANTALDRGPGTGDRGPGTGDRGPETGDRDRRRGPETGTGTGDGGQGPGGGGRYGWAERRLAGAVLRRGTSGRPLVGGRGPCQGGRGGRLMVDHAAHRTPGQPGPEPARGAARAGQGAQRYPGRAAARGDAAGGECVAVAAAAAFWRRPAGPRAP